MGVNNVSTFYHGDNDMHDNNDSSTSKVVDNESNSLRDTSDSNESSSFLRDSSSMHGDSKVFFNGLNGHKFYHNSFQDKIGFIPHNTDDIPVPPQFKIKWSSPDVPSIELLPGGISRSCPYSNEYDSPGIGHTKGGRKRK
jgi:hypothetical protein